MLLCSLCNLCQFLMFRLCKLQQLHICGVTKKLLCETSVEMLFRFQRWKFFENRLRYDLVVAKFPVPFFTLSLSIWLISGVLCVSPVCKFQPFAENRFFFRKLRHYVAECFFLLNMPLKFLFIIIFSHTGTKPQASNIVLCEMWLRRKVTTFPLWRATDNC